ncbi:MAG TPA: hypothetical protein VNA17_05175 [Pyrinomonadaceae bacterium]|nr:hypothetical protein [Pyrinomonadaceae bacterium]
MQYFAAVRILAILSLLIFANSLIAQTNSIYRLPEGTRIRVKVDTEVTSRVASVDDTFLAVVAAPVLVRDIVMLPAGTVVEGRVTGVTPAGPAGRVGALDVIFETLRILGTTRRIQATLAVHPRNEGKRTFNLLAVLGGTAAGAGIGAASSARGSLIGAGVGAAAGTLVALARTGPEAKIEQGVEFEIELKKEVVLPVTDY